LPVGILQLQFVWKQWQMPLESSSLWMDSAW